MSNDSFEPKPAGLMALCLAIFDIIYGSKSCKLSLKHLLLLFVPVGGYKSSAQEKCPSHVNHDANPRFKTKLTEFASKIEASKQSLHEKGAYGLGATRPGP